MAQLRRYANAFLSETQSDGVSFLYRSIPRSFLLLLALFLVVYSGYWASVLLGAPGDVRQLIVHLLGLTIGVALAITLMKIWPRLETALPRSFRTGEVGADLHRHHKYLAWAGAILLAVLCALGVNYLIIVVVMIMGLVGGVYILFRAEALVIRSLARTKLMFPWLWRGSGWRVFLVLTVLFVVILIVMITVATTVGSNEDPETHDVKFLPTVAVLIPIIALVLQSAILAMFMGLQVWRAWMRHRERQGKAYGPGRRALLRTHPASLACYIGGVNFAAGSFFFAYAVLVVLQSVAEARSQGVSVPIDVSGILVPTEVLDYVALATFALAWVTLLLNLSGTASKDRHRVLNRRVFASMSVFFLMVLFMHVVVANGDEFFISMAFRAMYIAGLALAPLLIFRHRWKVMAAAQP